MSSLHSMKRLASGHRQPRSIVGGRHTNTPAQGIHPTRRPVCTFASGDQELTPEEQQFYDEFLAKKRADRKQSIQDAKRRMRADPSARPSAQEGMQPHEGSVRPPAGLPVAPAGTSSPKQTPQTVQPPTVQTPANDPPARAQVTVSPVPTKSTPTAGAPLKRRGLTRQSGRAMTSSSRRAPLPMRSGSRAVPRGVLAADDEEEDEDAELDLGDPNVMSAFDQLAKQLLQDGGVEEAVIEEDGRASRKLQPRAGAAPGSTTGPAPSPRTLSGSQASSSGRGQVASAGKAGAAGASKVRSADPLQDPDFLKQMEAIMNAPDEELEEEEDPNDDGSAELAALLGGGAKGKGTGGAGKKAPPAAGIKERLVNMDDIDWEALEAYEDFEKSLEQRSSRRSGAVKGPSAATSSSIPLKPPSPPVVKPTPEAGKGAGAAGGVAAIGTGAAASTGRKRAGSAQPRKAGATASKKADAKSGSKLSGGESERDESELQELLAFLEQMDAGDDIVKAGGGEGSKAGSQAQQSGESGRDAAQLQVLERMLLGKDWQQRELGALMGAGGSNAAEGLAAGEVEPWADEVTSLLLGLVLMSHARYLKTPLFPEEVAEEARAATVWNAPFALIVHDDSRTAALEYANKQALELLGLPDFVDVFDSALGDIMAEDDAAQQEWLWAASELDAAPMCHKVVPELRFRQRGAQEGEPGRTVVAKNVLLFQVDSLDEDPVGTAMLIRDWHALP